MNPWDSVGISLDDAVADALRAALAALEPHVNVEGDCKTSMFLGGCYQCAAYFALDDVLVRDASAAQGRG